MKVPSTPLPPLKRPPKHGVYLWWPKEGVDWIHPDDLELAEQMIPGPRVFKRVETDEKFSNLLYGESVIRVLPTLWLEIEVDGYEIGDVVEVKSRMGKDRPLIATITDIFWDHHQRSIEYYLSENGNPLPKPYRFEQFQPAHNLSKPLDPRQAELAAKSRLR